MNSPSPTSQPSVNLPVAISPALSRPAFASLTSLIKFGLLPSYPHIFIVEAPSPVPCLALALQTSPCTWHTPGLRWPFPSRTPCPLYLLVHNTFLPLFQSPPCIRVPRGSCFLSASLSSLRSSGSHLLLPLLGVPEQPPFCLQLSHILSCRCHLIFFSFPVFHLDWGISILRILQWGGKHFVHVSRSPGSVAPHGRKARGFAAFLAFTNQMDVHVGSKCSPAHSLPPNLCIAQFSILYQFQYFRTAIDWVMRWLIILCSLTANGSAVAPNNRRFSTVRFSPMFVLESQQDVLLMDPE